MKRTKTDEEKALLASWNELVVQRAEHEAGRHYAHARLCRVDDPDEVASLQDVLITTWRAVAKVDCELDRVRNDLRDLQPERIITEVATLDQIASALAERTLAERTPPPPARTPEELAQDAAEFQKLYSPEARAERAVRRLGLLPQAVRLQALVNTGLFVLEADGRLLPIEPPPAAAPVP